MAIENVRPLARWLKILVEANDDSDNIIIDLLINTFQEAIKNIQDEESKGKLKKATSFLQELKQRELDDKKNDEQDIDKIEELLAKF